ncbi:MAG: hypothetical protein QXG65_06330 [Thermoplasmata archaeon]
MIPPTPTAMPNRERRSARSNGTRSNRHASAATSSERRRNGVVEPDVAHCGTHEDGMNPSDRTYAAIARTTRITKIRV